MEVGIIGDTGPTHTDTPRDLTIGEAVQILEAGRLAGIKLHRQWTNSTLRAAVREVDAVFGLRPAGDL